MIPSTGYYSSSNSDLNEEVSEKSGFDASQSSTFSHLGLDPVVYPYLDTTFWQGDMSQGEFQIDSTLTSEVNFLGD